MERGSDGYSTYSYCEAGRGKKYGQNTNRQAKWI